MDYTRHLLCTVLRGIAAPAAGA